VERLGERNNPDAAYSAYRNLALELRDYGFNLNLGPVVDLNLNPANPVIGRLRRSYGADPDHVTAYAKAFVYAHNESGVLTAAKHFPGHGSSDTDSHDVLVNISDSWQERELRPYRKLIEDDAIDMIMVGHLYHPAFSDSPDVPTTLSPKAIEQVLRESLNYDGVVITDDLDMRGVRQNADFEERVVGAVAAGNDILLITNGNGYQPDLPERVAEVIRAAIAEGRLSEARIRQSYERIMALKDELARLQRTATSAGEDRGLQDHTSGG
jgi:beta-N-acetylhexosaminidase